jgi:hypothetical protein
MAVSCDAMICTAAGKKRADKLAAVVPCAGWQRLSCADGSKGPRFYDWALIGTKDPRHRLLVRRSLAPGEKGELELAFFRCWLPRPVTLPEFAAVAGARWGVEDCLAEAKSRRLLNLHIHVTMPQAFHQQWSDWRRYRQAAARESHYARRDHETLF